MFEQVHEPTETRSENAPRHAKARHFQSLGLVKGVRNFTEFEARVTSLPTEQARGAAFEVFAEVCLATQRIYQAREVWPGNSMPSTLRQQLRLPSIDMGVDGVFVTVAGDPVCYQSKFRIGRPALTWTELSTFYGLADASAGRLVFTNCDEVARVAEERSGAIFIRGSDLDRLTRDDFRIIEAWLAEQPAEAKKKEPKPHQLAALKDIVAGLSRGPRATALMACGSGKTLVALWAAERLHARTVLVLLPSLALVRQTLHEWLHETAWPDVQFLCVCSDPTVRPEDDSLLVRPSDLDFAVTTRSADVRRFLERHRQPETPNIIGRADSPDRPDGRCRRPQLISSNRAVIPGNVSGARCTQGGTRQPGYSMAMRQRSPMPKEKGRVLSRGEIARWMHEKPVANMPLRIVATRLQTAPNTVRSNEPVQPGEADQPGADRHPNPDKYWDRAQPIQEGENHGRYTELSGF